MADKVRKILRRKDGSSAVEFIFTSAVLILVFAMLVSALVYVMAYYNAAFITRKVVRNIEVTGQYNSAEAYNIAHDMGGDTFEDMQINVTASYFQSRKIQLRDGFTVKLRAYYTIPIMRFGASTQYLRLPINVELQGMSEVYWKR